MDLHKVYRVKKQKEGLVNLHENKCTRSKAFIGKNISQIQSM